MTFSLSEQSIQKKLEGKQYLHMYIATGKAMAAINVHVPRYCFSCAYAKEEHPKREIKIHMVEISTHKCTKCPCSNATEINTRDSYEYLIHCT